MYPSTIIRKKEGRKERKKEKFLKITNTNTSEEYPNIWKSNILLTIHG
jgi:hypothetical protein